MKPRIRFKGYTEAWERRKLKDCVEIERGGSPRPIDDYITNEPDGLNWIKIGDAPEQGNVILKTAEKIKTSGLSKTRQVQIGDLILSNSMSFGKPYITGINGCIHDGWLLIRDVQGAFDLIFLCQLLGTDQMLKQYKSRAAGSTVNNLNKELVGNTLITVPTKCEQHKLGGLFQKIDNLIKLHQRKYEKIVNIKKALLEKMFPADAEMKPKIRFKRHTDIWEQRKLGDVTSYVISSLKLSDVDKDGQYDLYDATKVVGKTNKNVQRKSYITIIKDGSGVGTVRLLPKNTSFISTMGAILANNNEEEFLYALLQKFNFSVYINGATIPHLYYSEYKQDIISIPIKYEQHKIGQFFKQLDNLITLYQRQLEKLKNIKSALLEKMFV